nr:hypothetical protein [Tanacetum cinerariifolium]
VVPKKVLERMNVPGLKREHVASHLQEISPPKDAKTPVESSISASSSSVRSITPPLDCLVDESIFAELVTHYGSYHNYWEVNQFPRNRMS